MPYSIYYFDEGFTDYDIYDPDDPCDSCNKESCFGCDIADPYSYLERDWDIVSGDVT